MNKTKYFGIVGGMGSKATSVFFERVIENTKATRDQDHIDAMILNHASLPDRTEVILEDKGDLFLEQIEKDFKLLEMADVEYAAIPCNSAHYFYEKIQQRTTVSIINMVEETIKEIHLHYGQGTKVALLATDGTVRSGIYKKHADKYGLDLLIPDIKAQQDIMDVIYHNIKGHLNLDSSLLEELIETFIFEEKCSCVIIGCTELSCIKVKDELKVFTYDAMDILVRKTIEIAGKNKNPSE